jgi:hypothetical protein
MFLVIFLWYTGPPAVGITPEQNQLEHDERSLFRTALAPNMEWWKMLVVVAMVGMVVSMVSANPWPQDQGEEELVGTFGKLSKHVTVTETRDFFHQANPNPQATANSYL